MNCGRLALLAGLGLAWGSSAAAAADLYQLPPMSIVQYGGYCNDIFLDNYKNRQLNLDVDLDAGRGFYDNTRAIFALPVKGLSEEQVNKDIQTPLGAPLCHIAMSSFFPFVVDGKPLDKAKLRSGKGLGHHGEETQSEFYIATVRRHGDGRELCLYGTEKEPVLTAKF